MTELTMFSAAPPSGVEMISVASDPSQQFEDYMQQLAFKVGIEEAKIRGKSEVGMDWISVLAGLLTTLLPLFMDGCKKDAKKLVAAAKKPGFFERLNFEVRANLWLTRKAKVDPWHAMEMTNSLVKFGQSGKLTEQDAAAYYSHA